MSVCCVCAFIIQWYLSVVLTCGVWFTFLWDAEGTGQRDRCNGMLIHQCWKTPYQWQNTHRRPQYLDFITLQLYLPLKLMCQIAKAPECSQTATNWKHKKLVWLSNIAKQTLHQRALSLLLQLKVVCSLFLWNSVLNYLAYSTHC